MFTQRLYIYLLLILTLLANNMSSASSFCPEKIKILYGPFISERYISAKLESVHLEIARLTQCQVTYHISQNYLLFNKKIKQQKHDIVIIASAHLPYIKPFQYKRVASGLGPIRISIFGKKDKGIFTLNDLEGKRVLLNGETSIAGLAWESITKDRINTDNVNIIYTVNTNNLLFNLLKGRAEAAISFNQFYNKLPSALKNKLSIVDEKKVMLPASAMVRQNLKPSTQLNIQQAFINDKHWVKRAPSLELPISDKAHGKLAHIFKLTLK